MKNTRNLSPIPTQLSQSLKLWKSVQVLLFLIFPLSSYAQGTFQSKATASWGAASTWTLTAGADEDAIPDGNDDVIITNTYTVTMNGHRACLNLTINLGGELVNNRQSGLNKTLTIHGNFTINGTFSGNSTNSVLFDTNDKTIYGSTGTITNDASWNFKVNIIIDQDAVISKENSFNVSVAGKSVTNNGSVTSTDNTLVLTGNWTNNTAGSTVQVATAITGGGTLNASASDNTVIYAGATSYIIGVPFGNTYHHLTLQGGGTKTDTGALTINGTVTIGASTTLATGTQTITLTSTAASTARIGNSEGAITTSGAGEWRVQRYIPSVAYSTSHWNDLSTPISGNNLGDWDNELLITIGNSCPDGPAANWNSIYYWDEGVAQDWVVLPSCVQALSPTRGYELWLATSYSGLSATTMDSRGTPNFGNQSATLAGAGNGKWSLIGNPYASPIDWDVIFTDVPSTSNLSNGFQVFDESIADYAIYDGGTPANSTGQLATYNDGIMAAHQGFWVQNSGGSAPTLTFKESYKYAGVTNHPLVKEMNPTTNSLKMRLYSEGRKNACETVIKIRDNASEFFDSHTDFGYLKSRDSLTPSFTPVTADGRRVRVKAIPVKPSLSVPITATFGAAGEYKIDFSGLESIDKYDRIILEDVKAGIFFPLKMQTSKVSETQTSKVLPNRTYYFTQGKVAPALKGEIQQHPPTGGRVAERKFILHFSNLQGFQNPNLQGFQNLEGLPIDVEHVDEGVMIHFNFDEPTNSAISLYNVLGQDLLTRNVRTEKESITLPIEKNNQLYFVKITSAAGTTVMKIFR